MFNDITNEIMFNDDETYKLFNNNGCLEDIISDQIFFISSMYNLELKKDKIISLTGGSITIEHIGKNSNIFKESINLFKVTIIKEEHIKNCSLDVLRGLYQLHRALYMMDGLDNDSLKIYNSNHKNITNGGFKYL